MSRSREQLESQIREQFELIYKKRVTDMYNMYETRYNSLNDSIRNIFQRIKNDEILGTMFNDNTTSIHMEDRVKEIFGEVVHEERQLVFKRLGQQINNLKFENSQLKRNLDRLKENNNCLEKQFSTERLTFEQTKNNVNEQLKKTKEENCSIVAERNRKEKQLEDLSRKVSKIQEIEQENYELKTLLTTMQVKMDSLLNQTKQLHEQQDNFDRKYKNKKRQYKDKIEQYKNVINQLRNKNRSQVYKTQDRSDQKMGNILREHQQKINQLRRTNQREKTELERKYELKMKQTQNYFEKILQNKMLEIEQNTTNFYEKMQEEGHDFQRKIKYYEQNFINMEEFEEQIRKRQDLLHVMKRKLQQFESNNQAYAKTQEMLLNKLRQVQSDCSDYKQKVVQLEQLNRQLTNKYKSFEQSNSIFKINEKKVKEQFQDYQRIVKKLKDQNEDLKSKCNNLQDAKSNFNNNMRQQQRKIRDLNQQIQVLTKKNKKSSEVIDLFSKEKEQLSQQVNKLKKEITSLQYKIKDQQLAINLTKGSSQSKIVNLQQQLKDKKSMMFELDNKYNQVNKSYQEEKKKNYEVENLLKKYEMENKFYKQSGEMHKEEHQAALEEIKKVIFEKNQKIEQLESQNKHKVKQVKEIQLSKSGQIDSLKRQNKNLRYKIALLCKATLERLQHLRKEGKLVKEYLKSRQSILKNDQAICLSTFRRQMNHLESFTEKQKDILARKIKDEMNSVHLNDTKLIKNQCQQKIKSHQEKSQYQKSLLRQQIKEKQQRLIQMNQEVKKGQLEIKKQKDECRTYQKQLQQATIRCEQLKDHYQHKLKEIVKEMKEEKDNLISQQEDKRNQLEQQINQLISTVKQLKQETQLIMNKHEEEKLTINAQLRTVKQQEEAVKKIVHQKDLQMDKYQKNYQTAEQAKKNIENQLRGYADTLNNKIQVIHQLELKRDQLTGQFNLFKNKCERMSQQNSELKRKLAQREQQYEESIKLRSRMQAELRDIKGALNRSNKNQELRSLNQLSMQTLQLSQKVNEMRKFNTLLDSKAKTPLRS